LKVRKLRIDLAVRHLIRLIDIQTYLYFTILSGRHHGQHTTGSKTPSRPTITTGGCEHPRYEQPSDTESDRICGSPGIFSTSSACTSTDQNQLIFALSEAQNWVQEHEGYQFSALYDFIIDFFEAPDLGPKAKERTKALLAWWNR